MLLPSVWITSLVLSSEAHIFCLLRSGRCYFIATTVLDGHPMLVASIECWVLLLQLASTFTDNLSYMFLWCLVSTSLYDPCNPRCSTSTEVAPSPMASSGLSQCQASTALHDPLLHAFSTSITWVTLTLPSSDARIKCNLC